MLGYNQANQCDKVYKTFTNVIDVACGSNHSVALKDDETIECWGNNDYNQCDIVYKTFTNLIQIYCGLFNSIARLDNGTIECREIIDLINVILFIKLLQILKYHKVTIIY